VPVYGTFLALLLDAALYIAAWLLIPADGDDLSLAAAWIASHRDHAR
jgi:hypothetical protein